MISVIVYGRNDSHGYNLHKRVALSLNNFGEILTDDQDEILFVDYNTSDGLPSLPEAIMDTLTEKAIRRLKIIRVPPSLHRSLGLNTHLQVVEPIARNVALRRSDERNKWILSTNTDLIVVPLSTRNLTSIVSKLEDGIYGLPRFELPEGLWEGLNRNKPREVIQQVNDFGARFGLRNTVYSGRCGLFDAPGDFQLMLRQDLIDIDGFDETMILGWHVDSNIAKRLSFLRGNTRDLSGMVHAYHCDHTRVETQLHQPGTKRNSLHRFEDHVASPYLSRQRDAWGLQGHEIPQIPASRLQHQLETLLKHSVSRREYVAPSVRQYNLKGFDRDEPNNAQLFPFLMDLLLSHPDEGRGVYWLGHDDKLAREIAWGLNRAGRATPVEVVDPGHITGRNSQDLASFDWVVMDFRTRKSMNGSRSKDYVASLLRILRKAAFRYWSFRPHRREVRIIGIDVINKSHTATFLGLVTTMSTPFSIGFRHGTISPITLSGLSRLLELEIRSKLKRTKRVSELFRKLATIPRSLKSSS